MGQAPADVRSLI